MARYRGANELGKASRRSFPRNVWIVMSNDTYVSLASIEAALGRLDRKVLLDSLQEGVPPEVVRSELTQVGLGSSPELEALYGWRNGTVTDGVKLGEIDIFPGFYLLSLEDAILNYRTFVGDMRWQVGWLPLFADGGGDFYIIDLGMESGRPVRGFWIEWGEHSVEFSSLNMMLRTVAMGFARGVLFLDSNGYLSMDFHEFEVLASEVDPGVKDWDNYQ